MSLAEQDGDRVYSDRKITYFETLKEYLDSYSKCFLVQADNVGSLQLQQIRASLRGRAEVLMGKNTMIRRAMRDHAEKNPSIKPLIELMRGNVGFIFTNDDLVEVREIVESNKKPAPARVNAIAPQDVLVPPGPTGQGPEKTSFFQALSIATKINRGMIEILKEVNLIKAGEKVGASEASLLNMLGISPFAYSLKVQTCFDNGVVFSPKVLDITSEDILEKFAVGITNIACVSLAIGYPTAASVPHSIINGFRNLLAIAAEVEEITFKEAETMKAYLADPSAFAAAAPAATEAATEEAAPAKEESEESSSDAGGFDMFG